MENHIIKRAEDVVPGDIVHLIDGFMPIPEGDTVESVYTPGQSPSYRPTRPGQVQLVFDHQSYSNLDAGHLVVVVAR